MNDNRKLINIFCVADYYLPGFKAGGPIKTIANAIERLNGRCKFSILTSDHDIDGEKYIEIDRNIWIDKPSYRIYYAGRFFYIYELIRLLISFKAYDLIYLNSFFSRKSILIMIFNKIKLLNVKPVLLAPRGEFSRGALAIKPIRKKIFLKIVNFTGLCENLSLQASGPIEKNDICRALNCAPKNIYIAKDLVSKKVECKFEHQFTGICKIIFLSRIAPIKNIQFLINAMMQVKSDLIFDIYGPVEDGNYWQECKRLISRLPSNISVEYKGLVHPNNVISIFGKYDLFALPSKGESFAYVIFESLSAGTPVMISDQTPWISYDSCAIQSLPIDDPAVWANNISAFIAESDLRKKNRRIEASKVAAMRFSSEGDVEENFNMFRSVKMTFKRQI
jgi:glycosyltransferase involved in cell wall biosynthesis